MFRATEAESQNILLKDIFISFCKEDLKEY